MSSALNINAQISYAATGFAAKGVIMREENGVLQLTTTPCAADAHKAIVVFKQPYQKIPTNAIFCDQTKYDQFTVQQE
jgi:hypothetical protein